IGGTEGAVEADAGAALHGANRLGPDGAPPLGLGSPSTGPRFRTPHVSGVLPEVIRSKSGWLRIGSKSGSSRIRPRSWASRSRATASSSRALPALPARLQ